jgi:diguanylate cyclase (GGDEF)-like protein
MMDLDGFKDVNDTLGHQTGDKLLEQVGKRLLQTLRKTDTVARLGGDEFAILISNATAPQAELVADKVINALSQPFDIDAQNLFVGASIGIALYPEHGDNASTLIQRADVAMYVAKRNRLGKAVYDPKDDTHSLSKLSLLSDLRHALENDHLELYYQPQLLINNGKTRAVEALLRWRHPTHGMVPPDEVVSLAEQTGLINPLTYWVLNKALKQCALWRQKGRNIKVSVNLSVYNLQDELFTNQIEQLLARNNLPAEALILEITESAMMTDPSSAIQLCRELDTMGIDLSVDDFGTGFSSLSYLKKFPMEELKIDKSFVLDMRENENDMVIVRSTIELAHNLGLKVVAEGVEDQETMEILSRLGCDYAQGYHISRPVPDYELTKWMDKSEWDRPLIKRNAS